MSEKIGANLNECKVSRCYGNPELPPLPFDIDADEMAAKLYFARIYPKDKADEWHAIRTARQHKPQDWIDPARYRRAMERLFPPNVANLYLNAQGDDMNDGKQRRMRTRNNGRRVNNDTDEDVDESKSGKRARKGSGGDGRGRKRANSQEMSGSDERPSSKEATDLSNKEDSNSSKPE